MPTDVTHGYGMARGGEPLNDTQQARLRELAAKGQRSADELYELGALKAKGKATQQGRQVLDDVGHAEDAAQASRRRAQAQAQGHRPAPQPRSQARTSPVSDSEYNRRNQMLREHLAQGN